VVRKRPELPTDGEPIEFIVTLPVARFSEFPFDTLARYINYRVKFTVERLDIGTAKELETPWIVRKLT
jgi:hypothetical protein